MWSEVFAQTLCSKTALSFSRFYIGVCNTEVTNWSPINTIRCLTIFEAYCFVEIFSIRNILGETHESRHRLWTAMNTISLSSDHVYRRCWRSNCAINRWSTDKKSRKSWTSEWWTSGRTRAPFACSVVTIT